MKDIWKQELVSQYKRELAECLAREVDVWERKSRIAAEKEVGKVPLVYDTTYNDASYGVVINPLASDDAMLTLLIEVQPNDPERISLIATPREIGSGGWTDDQMGIMSELVFLKT